ELAAGGAASDGLAASDELAAGGAASDGLAASDELAAGGAASDGLAASDKLAAGGAASDELAVGGEAAAVLTGIPAAVRAAREELARRTDRAYAAEMTFFQVRTGSEA
ncbi:hypothetical protein AB0I21_35180, partial [Dactylosporangium sp. NPDC050588]